MTNEGTAFKVRTHGTALESMQQLHRVQAAGGRHNRAASAVVAVAGSSACSLSLIVSNCCMEERK